MSLFAVEYQDVPGSGVIAQGGLKFRASEESLFYYFAPILHHVSLNDLIGEAVFWILMPSTLAIWFFPAFLYLYGLPLALFLTLAVHIVAEVVHQVLYIKPLNYLIFFFGNRILQVVVYVILAVVFALSGHIGWTIALASVFIFYAVGLDNIFFGLLDLLVAMFVGVPKSDQLLRLIGWRYGRKYTKDDPTKWSMFDEKLE